MTNVIDLNDHKPKPLTIDDVINDFKDRSLEYGFDEVIILARNKDTQKYYTHDNINDIYVAHAMLHMYSHNLMDKVRGVD